MWQKLTTVALLGLGRSPMPEELHLALQSEGIAPDVMPEKALLDGAALLYRQHLAHAQFSGAAHPLPTPPNLKGERLGGPAIDKILDQILFEGFQPALPEFLKLAAAKQLHVPPAHLPALLELAIRDASLRALLQAVAGPRADWLIALNPRWGIPGRKSTKDKHPEQMSDEAFNATGLEHLSRHSELDSGQSVVKLLSTPGYAWSDALAGALVANFSKWLDRHGAVYKWHLLHYQNMLLAAAYGCNARTCKAFETEWAPAAVEAADFRKVVNFRKKMIGVFEFEVSLH